MRADVSVDGLSNSPELIAAGMGRLDVKSRPSSCLSANPSWPPVITATAVCLRILERDSCQHFCCLSLSVKRSTVVHLFTLLDWLRFSFHCKSCLQYLAVERVLVFAKF